jgi:hypothetical protein
VIALSKYALDTLRNDKEFNLYRGWSADDNSEILVLSPVAEYPAPEILKRLEHEYANNANALGEVCYGTVRLDDLDIFYRGPTTPARRREDLLQQPFFLKQTKFKQKDIR